MTNMATLDRGNASCRLYFDAPGWNDQPTCAIGAFTCVTQEDGAALLEEAAAAARARGIEALIGPMDGDTWHRYRVVTWSDGSRPFLLEPVSGPHDLGAFEQAGFEPVSHYISTGAPIADVIGEEQPAVPGLSIAAWDGRDANRFLGRLYQMSAASFARNAFYKPITEADFRALYEPIVPLLDPELILFARAADGNIAGYLFAIGEPPATDGSRRLIVKTYASGVKGCGRWLLDTIHRRASGRGFTHVVHALMHVDNISAGRSARTGARVFRRYALMGRMLQPVAEPRA